ncbi:IS3 family transposase [Thiomicrorhabdus aquaedulcis]|uniref:IS3 family transposase n=1 Tax=Thiomicrorhabdus aquaedulcis TaxID=2211106 RepID=UPI000FD98BB4
MKHQKRYDDQLKQQAIEMALEGSKSVAQIARDLDIKDNTLYGWVDKHRRDNPDKASTKLVVAKRPKKPHYYPVGKELPNIPNHLNREFNPPNINTHWVGDITYIRSHQGWSYLATVMDLGNKEIVGYEISKTPDAQLAKRALINAIAKHQPDTTQLMFHSDQGVQYTANLFKDCLALHKITQSMSRRGNCWDDAVQERFFRNLKTEYLNDLSFINHQSVVDAVEKYIGFYNHKRLNSAIDYLTPVQKRLEMQKLA